MIKVKRKIIFSLLTGMLISFCYVAGYSLDRYDTVDLTQKSFYLKWLLGGVAIAGLVYGLYVLLGRKKQKDPAPLKISVFSKVLNSHFGCVLVLLLCWLPALLSLFPGAFSYDAYQEWEQVAQGAITSHHPVIHVLFLGGLVEGLHSLTGSYNAGIAVCSILQMVILANVLAYTISFLRRFQLPEGMRLFALCFYALSPVIQLFSISATKDVLFSAALLLFFLHILRIFCTREPFWENRKNIISFGLSAFFSMILRNNGLYIVAITLFVMAVMELRRQRYLKKGFLAMLAGVAILYGLYVGPFYGLLNVTPGGIEEMMSVPLQQMARVHRYNYDSLEPQDLELLYQVIPKENWDSYRSTVSDFIKKGFNREAFEANKKEFVKLWAKWGVQHPLTYVNSFLVGTVDYWYPNSVVDGYKDVYDRSSFFDYRVSQPGTEIVLLPIVHRYYAAISLDKEVQKLPFVFLILSPGWYILMWLVLFSYLWCYKRYALMVPMLIFILTLLTVILGPIALVRYVLIFYLAFPVLSGIFLYSESFIINQIR